MHVKLFFTLQLSLVYKSFKLTENSILNLSAPCGTSSCIIWKGFHFKKFPYTVVFTKVVKVLFVNFNNSYDTYIYFSYARINLKYVRKYLQRLIKSIVEVIKGVCWISHGVGHNFHAYRWITSAALNCALKSMAKQSFLNRLSLKFISRVRWNVEHILWLRLQWYATIYDSNVCPRMHSGRLGIYFKQSLF